LNNLSRWDRDVRAENPETRVSTTRVHIHGCTSL
jgi:hypothetical protein